MKSAKFGLFVFFISFLLIIIKSFVLYSQETNINKNKTKKTYKDLSPVFLKSSVLNKNVFNIDFTLAQDHRESKNSNNINAETNFFNNYCAFINIGFGALDAFEIGVIFGIVFAHDDNKKPVPNAGEKYNTTFFNPELYLKWKAITSKKTDMNFAVFFSVQPSRTNEFFAGNIYQIYIFSGANSFRLGFLMDFPLKRVVFYLNNIFTLGIQFAGQMRGYGGHNESEKLEFESESDKYYWVLFSETGLHFIANSVFSVDLKVTFVYNSKVTYYYTNFKFIFYSAYYIAPGLKINFIFSDNIFVSLDFNYYFYSTIKSDLIFNLFTNTNTGQGKATYSLYFTLKALIDF